MSFMLEDHNKYCKRKHKLGMNTGSSKAIRRNRPFVSLMDLAKGFTNCDMPARTVDESEVVDFLIRI